MPRILIALLLLSLSLLRAGSLHKIWELDLRKTIRDFPASGQPDPPGIAAVQFSSDGKRIAVSTGVYGSRGNLKSRLIVVHTESPGGETDQFDIDGLALDSDLGGGGPKALQWSPSGDYILAGRNLVPLHSGSVCAVPDQSALISSDRITALKLNPPRFEFYDFTCTVRDQWYVGPEFPSWVIEDVSLDRGIISAQRSEGTHFDIGARREFVFVDPTARMIVLNRLGFGSRFADRGKISCGTYPFAKVDEGLLRCIDVDTGAPIGENSNMHGAEHFSASERSSRIVVTDYRSFWTRLWHLVHYDDYDTEVTGRIVWDVRTGKEVVAWPVQRQSFPIGLLHIVKEPFKVTISPDGQYIVEGGDGILKLFKIDP